MIEMAFKAGKQLGLLSAAIDELKQERDKQAATIRQQAAEIERLEKALYKIASYPSAGPHVEIALKALEDTQ